MALQARAESHNARLLTCRRPPVAPGISTHPVSNEEETLNWLFHGEVNRTTAEHLLNKESNRSHCIFTVYITQRARLGSSAAKVCAARAPCVLCALWECAVVS